MTRIVFLHAHFKKTGHEEKADSGSSLIDSWVNTGHSDCLIDGERLANDLQNVADLAHENGHKIINVIPVNSGQHRHEKESNAYGYGFSITSGLIVMVQE